MKTLTEFSGVILRKAAALRQAVLATIPAPPAKAAPDSTESTPVVSEGENTNSPEAPAEPKSDENPASNEDLSATSTEAPSSEASETSESSTEAKDDNAPEVDSSEPAEVDAAAEEAPLETKEDDAPNPNEAIAKAIEEELGLSGDRLDRLVLALDALHGKKLDSARLVRVYDGETPPQGSVSAGGLHFVVDRMAAAPKPNKGNASGDKSRGGKGRDRNSRDGKRSTGGGPGGNDRKGGRGRPQRGRDGGGGGERVHRSEMPSGGLGWGLTRAPRDPNDRPKRGKKPFNKKKRGPSNRQGPPRGPRGDNKAPVVEHKAKPPQKSEAAQPKPNEETTPIVAAVETAKN